MPDSVDGNMESSGRSAGEWTDEEMEEAEPMPLPEVPDDEDEAGESTEDAENSGTQKKS